MAEKRLCVLGSTGSIGTQCLDVATRSGYTVYALAASRNISLLEAQIRRFRPALAAVADEAAAADLAVRVADTPTRVLPGRQGVLQVAAAGCEVVLNALVGVAGLEPTLLALSAGSDIALANKETLVTAGELVMKTAAELGRRILPVDSEHSAIFQCLQGSRREDLASLVLTASGGPFRGWSRDRLRGVTPAQALAHPNWSMGRKISIDSATMMNKGLEVIEAVHLFGVTPEQVQVVVHPESVVHSLVEWQDGAMIGQLSLPDMRLAIQYALTYPARQPSPVAPLKLPQVARLTFEQPDRTAFGCLAAAEEALRRGGLTPAALNGANEEAVALFLEEKIHFLQIEELVRRVLESPFGEPVTSVEQVLQADRAARELVRRQFS